MKAKKGTLTFKSFEIMDSLLIRIFSFLSKTNIQNTINYFNVDEEDNSIAVNYSGTEKLYAIKLQTGSNRTIRLKNFESFCNDFKVELDEVEIMLSIVKQKNNQAIYVFTLNKEIAKGLSNRFGIPLLKPYDILTALYHIFLLDVYEIKEKRLINRYESNNSEDPDILYRKFPSLISIGADNMLRDYTPYQITSLKNRTNFSIIKLFRTKWEGVCHLFFNLSSSKVKGRLEMLYNTAKMGDPNYKKRYDELKEKNQKAIQKIEEHCFLFNGVFFLKDKTTASTFQDSLGVVAEERYLSIDKILSRTLLFTRDIDFDIIADEPTLGKYFATSLCSDCLDDVVDDGDKFYKPDFFGTDINGNFFNYMLKKNPSPHALVFGTTGAGKSVAALKMMCHIIDYDFKEARANDLNINRKIRFLNVGYTGGRIFDNIKKNNEKKTIEIIPSSINNLRFSLFDFDNMKSPTEEEWLLFVNFINLVLDISSQDANRTLTNQESSKLQVALLKLLQEEKYPSVSLREIQLSSNNADGKGAYDKIIDEILEIKDENGNPKYNLKTKSDELPPEYRDRFYKPTLADLINIVLGETKNQNIAENERAIFESLKMKLDNIKTSDLFSKYSNVVLKENYPMYYVDFDKIKEDKKSFVSIGWLLIKNWYRFDKEQALEALNKGKRRPDTYYFIEEAHNFLNIPSFKSLILTFAKEVRKYGIHIILITQSVNDVDSDMAMLFSTACFVFLSKDSAVAYESIKKINAEKDLDKESKEVFDEIKEDKGNERIMFMKNSFGVNAFKLPDYLNYSNLFTPYDIG